MSSASRGIEIWMGSSTRGSMPRVPLERCNVTCGNTAGTMINSTAGVNLATMAWRLGNPSS